MRPLAVVVVAVGGKDGPRVPHAEDQDAADAFESGRKDESFGEAVRSQPQSPRRTPRRNLGPDRGPRQPHPLRQPGLPAGHPDPDPGRLRVTDALSLPRDCLVTDADGAPYLRYVNHKMNAKPWSPSTNNSTP